MGVVVVAPLKLRPYGAIQICLLLLLLLLLVVVVDRCISKSQLRLFVCGTRTAFRSNNPEVLLRQPRRRGCRESEPGKRGPTGKQ